MKRIAITLLVLSSMVNTGYAQIMTTETQGLKRSSLIKVEKISKKYEPQNFLIGGLGYHPSQKSIFAMVGTVKRFGLYGKLKTNFNFNSSFDHKIERHDYLFIEDTKKGKFSITGGGMYRINNPISLYAGFGYGRRWLNWITSSGEVNNLKYYSYKGYEMESGFICKLKNDVYLNVGGSLGVGEGVSFWELNLGFGASFDYLRSRLKNK